MYNSPFALLVSLAIAMLSVASQHTIAQQSPAPAPEHWVVVTCGHLIAVPGKPPLTNATVFIRNGTIEGVGGKLRRSCRHTIPYGRRSDL